jgi:uncharacterized membrane protein YfcA
MIPGSLFSIFTVIFFSHVVQTITGFAGSMLALPFLVLFIGLKKAKVLLMFIGIVWSLWILFYDHQFVDWKIVKFVISFMSVGIIIGLFIADQVPLIILLLSMGLIIITFSLSNLIRVSMLREKKIEPLMKMRNFENIALVTASGVIQGMIIMGGPLLVMFANHYITDKRVYRSTLSVIWIVLDFVILLYFFFEGVVNFSILQLSLLCLIPLAFSIVLGNCLYARLSNRTFKIITNLTLLVMGIFIIIRIYV